MLQDCRAEASEREVVFAEASLMSPHVCVSACASLVVATVLRSIPTDSNLNISKILYHEIISAFVMIIPKTIPRIKNFINFISYFF